MLKLAMRLLFGLAVVLASGLAVNAAQPYDEASFKEAQAAGKTVLINVTASWCPTCKKQEPTIKAVEKERPSLVVYDVDFDIAKDVLQRLKVRAQSTLIVYKGPKEVARSTAETDPGHLRALIAKGF
ncbi:MAG: thioredoxin family protein [Xanthobacteraceae bacterium]